MPQPLPQRKRAAIRRDIEAGQKSCAQIARDHGVARSTVSNIGKDIPGAFERSQTEKATHAHEADCKALRAQLKADLLYDCQRLRERAWSPYKVVVGTGEGAEVVSLDLPPLPDQRSAYTALGIAADKSMRLEQHDSGDGGLSAVDEWLRGMLGGQR